MAHRKSVLIAAALSIGAGALPASAEESARLILQITEDHLRGDMPKRFPESGTSTLRI